MIKKLLYLIFIFQFLIVGNGFANKNSITRSDFKLTSFNEFKNSVNLNIYDQFKINKNITDEFIVPSELINSLFIENFNSVSSVKTLEPNSLVATYQKLLDTNPKYIFHIYQAAKSRVHELEGTLAFNLIAEIEFILVEQLGKMNGIQVAPDTISKRTMVQLNLVYQTISTDLQKDAEVATEKFYELTGYELSTKQFSLVTGGLAAIGLYYLLDEEEGCTDPSVNLSINNTTVAEATGTATITATLASAADIAITIPLVATGSATSGTDYTAINSISISAGSTTGTGTFTPTNDSHYDASTNETAIFTIGTNGQGYCIGETRSVTASIVDDETAPTLSLAKSAASIAEDAGSAITLTATLSVATYETVTVAITPTGTAAEGSDYSTISDITIARGDTTGTTTFTPTNDTMYETATAETAILAVSGVTGGSATESGTQSQTISITADSDAAPTVTLASSASSVGEAGSDLTLTATLSNPTYQKVTVSIDGTGGSATEGTDFATVTDITIASGDITGTAAFNPTVDSLYDATSAESAVIAISGVAGGAATESGTQTASISITDGDSAPTVTIASSASTVGEGDSDLTLTATLSVATYANVTVSLGTSGTATSGSDYTAVASTVTISAGSTTATTTLNPTDDSGTYEDTETVIVAISDVSGGSASESGTQTTTVSITENETAPTVTLATSATSVSEDGSNLTLTATLSISTYEAVTVTLDPTGTGTEGTDYAAISNISISAGATTGTAVFNPTDDSKYESSTNETAIVAVTGVAGGGASESGTQSKTITITENDSAPTVTLASSSTTLDENSNSAITITATLSNTTYEAVTVAITPSGTALEGTDYPTISDITIAEDATTGTASFTTTDDCLLEGDTDETVVVAISGFSGGDASAAGSSQSVALAIDDDEGNPKVTLASSASSITEGAGSITLTASIGSCTYEQNIVVSLGVAGTGTEGTDYNDIPSTITITAGDTSATQAFTPVDDNLYDATSNETAIISITDVSGGTASEQGTQSETLTIVDAQSAPTVTLASSASSVGEDASDLTLTATLSTATYAAVTVTIDDTGGTGTVDTDFAEVSDITISAGSTTGTTAFNPTPDAHYDATSAETGVIAISGVSGGSATESGTQVATISIIDAESAPTLSIATNDTSLGEADSDATLTATLTNATYGAVTVSIATTGTADEGDDYANMADITIAAGSTTGTVAFNPNPDSLYDNATGTETAIINVGVSGGSATEYNTQTLTYTITDGDSAPTVTLTSSASTVYDSAGNLTITAAMNVATYENVTVVIDGTGGSATEGTDFTEVSNIVIAAGDASNITSFNPTPDSTYEGTETATLSISSVSGGGATVSGGTQTASITITEYMLNLASLYVYEGDSTATTYANRNDFTNVGAYQNSYLNPYTNVNLHKAWAHKYNGNYLTGVGTKIAVVDDNCFNPAHEMFADKTITYHSSSTTNDNGGGSCAYSHGMHVASIAAGQIDSPNSGQDGLFGTGNQGTGPSSYPGIANPDGATIGVAPDASLYYASSGYEYSGGYTYRYDAINDVFGAINSSGANVINNSWGYITCHTNPCNANNHFYDYRATDLVTLKNNNQGLSYAQLVAYVHNNHNFGTQAYNSDDYSSTSASHVTDFVNTAVNYMTNTGVIVWANSNYANSRDGGGATGADVSSGLPYFFTDLQKAWITVINVDVAGSTLSSGTADLQSATCGLAAAWCLAADGHYIYAAVSNNGGTPDYDALSGTSMASPIVSGGVALLTQAFPNHTPEQIVDRLLASADNTWIGTHSANLTMSNGVTHGYNATYGHGMMDLYSALAPILSNNFSRSLVYTGNRIGQQSQAASSSGLRLGSSFGRSVSNALSEEVYYYYDALDGGFEASLSNIISYQSTATNLINQLQSDILRLDSTVFEVQEKSYNYSFGNVLGTMGNKDTNLFSISIDTPSAPIQYFNKLNSDNAFGLASFNNPFVDSTNGGIGISSEFNYGDKKIMLGFHDSSLRSGLFGESEQEVKTLAVAVSSSSDNFANFTVLTGLMIEEDTLLDSKGSGALGFHGTNPHSLFAGVNFEKIISNDLSVKFVSTVGYSTLDTPVHSLIGEVSPITSSSFNLILNKYGVMHDRDRLSVSIGQPNRVETGTMTFRIPELADSEGNLTYANREIDLNPSGRQLDFGIDYVTRLDNDLILGFKHTLSKDFNHIDSSALNNTVTFTAKIDF